MRCIVRFTCLAFVMGLGSVHARAQQDKRHYVLLPPEQALLAVAYQPDSPLEFQNPRLLRQVDGQWAQSFRLRNRGARPIKAYAVGTSSGNQWTWRANDSTQFIMPGEIGSEQKDSGGEIVPLTDELRRKLQLEGPMKGVIILMVAHVEYSDGSNFDASPAFEAAQQYFEEVEARMAKRASKHHGWRRN